MTKLSLLAAGLIAAATPAAALAQAAPSSPPGATTYPTRPPETATPSASVDQPMPPDSSGTRITPDGTRSADPNNAGGPVAASDPRAKDAKHKKPR